MLHVSIDPIWHLTFNTIEDASHLDILFRIQYSISSHKRNKCFPTNFDLLIVLIAPMFISQHITSETPNQFPIHDC